MQNILKLIVVYIRLQQISYCYRWIHVVFVTKRIRNKALRWLHYGLRNFCNVIGCDELYFSLIWNTYMYKLQLPWRRASRLASSLCLVVETMADIFSEFDER